MALPLDTDFQLPPYTLRQQARNTWIIKHRDGRLYCAQVTTIYGQPKLMTVHYGRTGLSMTRTGFTWQRVREGKPTWRAVDNALRTIGAYGP